MDAGERAERERNLLIPQLKLIWPERTAVLPDSDGRLWEKTGRTERRGRWEFSGRSRWRRTEAAGKYNPQHTQQKERD